jgi:NAD(P)-dependent dehydrogenase (short-subunit alcohol dehydrogenase family)
MRQDMKTLLGIGSVAALGYLAAKTAMRRARALDLTGKVVLITGGSRGLGLALTREFAKHGARIAVCARDEVDLETVLAEFAGMGDNFLAVTCDVTDREQVDTMVMQIESLLGPIEVLVNSAGRIIAGPVENQGVESYEDAMNTNFWGPLYASYAVMDGMKGRRSGRIVNIASLGGKIAVPHLLPYSASKFALVGFSEGLRTGSPRNADFAGQNEKEYTWFTVSDSLPGVAVGSAAAARKIVDACIHGDAELILGATAKLATMLHAVMPDALNEILGFINTSLMPAPGRNGTRRKKGFESETAITQSGLTALTSVAEVANNQL